MTLDLEKHPKRRRGTSYSGEAAVHHKILFPLYTYWLRKEVWTRREAAALYVGVYLTDRVERGFGGPFPGLETWSDQRELWEYAVRRNIDKWEETFSAPPAYGDMRPPKLLVRVWKKLGQLPPWIDAARADQSCAALLPLDLQERPPVPKTKTEASNERWDKDQDHTRREVDAYAEYLRLREQGLPPSCRFDTKRVNATALCKFIAKNVGLRDNYEALRSRVRKWLKEHPIPEN